MSLPSSVSLSISVVLQVVRSFGGLFQNYMVRHSSNSETFSDSWSSRTETTPDNSLPCVHMVRPPPPQNRSAIACFSTSSLIRTYSFMFAAATAKDFQTLMLSRFFGGAFASCPLAVVGGAFSDLFGNDTRGIAIAIFSALVFIGPFASPIVGAFITQSDLGWRWTQYITGIMGGLAFILDVLFLEETYLKTLLCKRAAWIRGETQNFAIHHISEEEDITFQSLVEKHLVLPLKLLFLEPIILLITIYTAFIYGILYLFLEAYPIVFVQYRRMNPAVATLPYIGLIVGVLVGGAIVICFEPMYNRKLKENHNIPVPEERLPPMMVGAVLFPIGLFWFAWSGNYPNVHWIVPTLSGLLTGAALMTIFLQALNYLVDAYLIVAASAIAANTFLRSFFGAGFREYSPLVRARKNSMFADIA
jgi:DHA1 family multidrug resistance protein-like MFS transporter